MAKDIEWDFIKSEFEETTKSVRMIAREHNITHGAIQRTAKKHNWVKYDPEGIIKDKALIGRNPILGKIALRKAEEVITELGDSYSSLDEPLIMIYSTNYEMWIEVMLELKEQGIVAVSSKGSTYLSAEFNALKSIEKTLVTIANQLGLSISARKRIGMTMDSEQESASLFDISKEINGYDLDV